MAEQLKLEDAAQEAPQEQAPEAEQEQAETALARIAEGGLANLPSAEQMRSLCTENEAKRGAIVEYIKRNFMEGTDYGPTDDRSAKPTLKKPGAEKICRLFNTRPVWRKDADTWQMLGEPAGTVCYVCEIIDNTSKAVVGEGRGAETLGAKKRDANKTIKNAEKCALVDAALYTFCLSEMFTQDLGDNDPDPSPAPNADPNAPLAASRRKPKGAFQPQPRGAGVFATAEYRALVQEWRERYPGKGQPAFVTWASETLRVDLSLARNWSLDVVNELRANLQ